MTTNYRRNELPNARNVTRVALDNGIVVLIYENSDVQSAVITGSLRAGGIYETPEQNGLASLAAESLMRGTKHRDFDSIYEELESIGADLDYNAGTFKVGFNAKSLAEDLPILIELLADTLRQPTFPEDQVDRLRGEQLTYLHYQQQDTRWQASRAFRERLYPDYHPYHYNTRGTLETLPNLTIDQIRAFHENQYGPDGMIICIVGAVNSRQVLDFVRDHLGDWHNPQQAAQPELPAIDSPQATEYVHTYIPGKSQSDIVMGVLGPSRLDKDYRAAVVANSVLGQFGMMGRIGDVVREREGMAYYAYSSLDGGFGPGAWRISAGVNPLNVERAVELIRDEIRRLVQENISDDDLSDNQSYFTGRLPLQLESIEGVASTLHTIESYHLGLDYLLNYRDEIYKLNSDDLLQAAQRYLDPDALVISVAGPEEISQ